MPAPIYAGEFDDEKMAELARLIYQMLNYNYGTQHYVSSFLQSQHKRGLHE